MRIGLVWDFRGLFKVDFNFLIHRFATVNFWQYVTQLYTIKTKVNNQL